MASLSETLRRRRDAQEASLVRGPGGSVSQESTEEIQNLSSKAGLQAPPTTPLGQGLIGASPDQQKMAGTPQQKTAAIALASQPVENTLEGATRRAQVRDQATGQEQQAQQKSKDMQELGQLGERVTNFVDAQRQKLQAQAQAGQAVEVKAQDQFQGKDVSSIKTLLGQLRQNPNDMNTLLEVNKALGYDVNTQLDPNQINDLYQSATDAISSGGAGQIDDDLNVDDLLAQGNLGYDKVQLSQLLNIPEAQLGSMSVGQIRNAINAVGETEFSQTQGLEKKAVSGLAGQAERGLARDQAREASRVGTRATEADFSNLESQITNADQVTFGGQSYKVDDLLKDETISGIISDYMNSAPDSDLRKQIDSSEPALKDFILKNQALLQDAATQLSGGAGEFQGIQSANKALTNVGGIQMSDTLAQKLVPGFGELQASKVDPSTVPFLKFTRDGDPNTAQTAVNELNARAEVDPTVLDVLPEVSEEEYSGLFKNSGKNWKNYIASIDNRRNLEALPAQDNNPDAMLQSLVTNFGSADDLQGKMTTAKAMDTIGFASGFKAPSFLDTNRDGKLDPPSTIKDVLLQKYGVPNIHNSAGGQEYSTFSKENIGNVNRLDKAQQSLYDKLARFAVDGEVSADDLQKAGMTEDDMYNLWDSSRNAGSIDRGGLKEMVLRSENQKADSVIGNSMRDSSRDLGRGINSLKEALGNAGGRINEGRLKESINALETLQRFGMANLNSDYIQYFLNSNYTSDDKDSQGRRIRKTPIGIANALKSLGISY